jgi:hypothetical protein
VSFKTRIPLAKENEPWKWDILLDMVRQMGNDNILRAAADFYDYFEKEDAYGKTDIGAEREKGPVCLPGISQRKRL